MIINLLAFLIAAFIYFLPTVVACARNHTNALAIFILNLFLGWTLIGWVVALIWAVYNRDFTATKKRK